MNDDQFDGLTKGLAQPISRRHVLKLGAAAVLGGLFARSEAANVLAAKQTARNSASAPSGRLMSKAGPSAPPMERTTRAFAIRPVDRTAHRDAERFLGPRQEITSPVTARRRAPARSCDNGFSNCSTNSNCFCFTSTEGTAACACNSYCSQSPSCCSTADCEADHVCITSNGCTGCSNVGGVCVHVCTPSCTLHPSGRRLQALRD